MTNLEFPHFFIEIVFSFHQVGKSQEIRNFPLAVNHSGKSYFISVGQKMIFTLKDLIIR